MLVKRSDCMVDMKTAYKIANKFFLENDYASEKPGKITKVGYLPVNVRMHAMEHPKYASPKMEMNHICLIL